MIEVWKDIPGYEGLYQVSNLGNILSLNYKKTHKPHTLKHCISRDGYHRVNLCCNGVRKWFVHLLVAKSFIPNPLNKPQINHIDGDKDNNCVSNLEWVSGKENIQHAIRNGLRKIENHHYLSNGDHHASKPVLQYDLHGNFIKKWGCQSEAARFYNCNSGSINSCVVGRNKTCKGFIWRNQEGDIPLIIEVKPNRQSPRIIKQYSLNGELIHEWNGYKELFAKHPEYKTGSISACVTGKEKTAYGYVWKSVFI